MGRTDCWSDRDRWCVCSRVEMDGSPVCAGIRQSDVRSDGQIRNRNRSVDG